MAEVHFTGGHGALWAQPYGPNTQPVYLGCHTMGDVDEPQGDVEILYCRAPGAPNSFRAVGSLKGAAGAVTFSITADITDGPDPLERIKCPATIFVNLADSGRMDDFSNWQRQFVLYDAEITSRGLSGLVARTQDDVDRAEQTFDLSARELLRVFGLTVSRQTITETQDIQSVAFCNEFRCASSERPAQDVCELGFATAAAAGGSTANVLVTTNGGQWAATASDPFASDEDAGAVDCVQLGADATRVFVGRLTTDAGNAAEIAYSDDNGANWTTVDVGAVNGQYITELFALDRNNIWAVTDDGYIYFSSDAGLSWAVQSAGVLTSGAINDIAFTDTDVGWVGGDTNIIGRTVDGGDTWSLISGPGAEAANDVLTVEAIDRNRAWVGYSSGKLYYTENGGANWYERSFSGAGTGTVNDIKFLNVTYGFMVRTDGSNVGHLYRTTDGGFTWTEITTPTNAGLSNVVICDAWTVFASGPVQGGTGFIAKATV